MNIEDIKEVTSEGLTPVPSDGRLTIHNAAIAALRLALNPNGCTINCIVEPTRSGAGAWIRVFAVSLLQEEPGLEDITHAVGMVTNIPLAEKQGEYRLFLKGAGFNRAQHVADAVNKAMYYIEGSIKGRVL